MPWKEKTIEKLFWTIGEVAMELGVNTSLIRYWEKEFGNIRPKRTDRGDRLYTRKEIDLLKRIQHLVKDEGFTLNGAKEKLRQGSEPAPPSPAPSASVDLQQVNQHLLRVRAALIAMREEL